MEEAGGDAKRRRELESVILDKVGEVVSSIKTTKHVNFVISALHSLAILLFPVDSSSSISGGGTEHAHLVLNGERTEWWHAFYRGAAFPTLARVLLLGSIRFQYSSNSVFRNA